MVNTPTSWRACVSARKFVVFLALAALLLTAPALQASEADLAIPDLHAGTFTIFGAEISAWWLLFWGALVITGTLGISLYLRTQIRLLPAHNSMLNVAEVIYQTCKTYLIQQGKFLLALFALIAIAISYYLLGFGHAAEYHLTDRTIQELRLANVPDNLVTSLEPLKSAAPVPTKEAFIAQLRSGMPADQWEDLTMRRQKYKAVDLGRQGGAEEKIFNELNRVTEIDVVEMPLKDVVLFIQDRHGIPIVLSQKKLEEASVSTDTPVTKSLRGVTLRSALRLILKDLELTYVVRNEVLQITTPEDAESELITKVYPVGDLVVPPGLGMMMGGMGGASGMTDAAEAMAQGRLPWTAAAKDRLTAIESVRATNSTVSGMSTADRGICTSRSVSSSSETPKTASSAPWPDSSETNPSISGDTAATSRACRIVSARDSGTPARPFVTCSSARPAVA